MGQRLGWFIEKMGDASSQAGMFVDLFGFDVVSGVAKVSWDSFIGVPDRIEVVSEGSGGGEDVLVDSVSLSVVDLAMMSVSVPFEDWPAGQVTVRLVSGDGSGWTQLAAVSVTRPDVEVGRAVAPSVKEKATGVVDVTIPSGLGGVSSRGFTVRAMCVLVDRAGEPVIDPYRAKTVFGGLKGKVGFDPVVGFGKRSMTVSELLVGEFSSAVPVSVPDLGVDAGYRCGWQQRTTKRWGPLSELSDVVRTCSVDSCARDSAPVLAVKDTVKGKGRFSVAVTGESVPYGQADKDGFGRVWREIRFGYRVLADGDDVSSLLAAASDDSASVELIGEPLPGGAGVDGEGWRSCSAREIFDPAVGGVVAPCVNEVEGALAALGSLRTSSGSQQRIVVQVMGQTRLLKSGFSGWSAPVAACVSGCTSSYVGATGEYRADVNQARFFIPGHLPVTGGYGWDVLCERVAPGRQFDPMGSGQVWETVSVPVPAGAHEVTWSPKPGSGYRCAVMYSAPDGGALLKGETVFESKGYVPEQPKWGVVSRVFWSKYVFLSWVGSVGPAGSWSMYQVEVSGDGGKTWQSKGTTLLWFMTVEAPKGSLVRVVPSYYPGFSGEPSTPRRV